MRIGGIIAFTLLCGFAGPQSRAQSPGAPAAPGTACRKDQKLRIACTVKCADNYKNAALDSAKKLGIQIEFLELMGNEAVDLQNPRQHFDALIGPGGHDILPEYFLTQPPDNPEKAQLRGLMRKRFYDEGLGKTSAQGKLRDSFEHKLRVRYLSDPRYLKIPLLDTCYGMQMTGAILGLPLYVDLEADIGIPAQRGVSNTISVIQQRRLASVPHTTSRIESAVGREFSGEKNHHQGLHYQYWKSHREEFPRLKITASSHGDRIIEVMELPGRPYLGIQFHAERSEPKTRDGIYGWLLREACRNAAAPALPKRN